MKFTPLMKQYYNIKEKYKDAILLFRVGDFYETFGEDAIKCSQLLDIALTKRYPGSRYDIHLAGFPYHALDNYLYKLIKAGMRVAICDQLEDSNNKTENLVKRGVTELITPGVNLNDKVLHVRYNNFLTAIHIEENKNIGLAFLDISTGEFFITECNIDNTINIIKRINPSEIIYPKKQQKIVDKLFKKDFYLYAIDDWYFEYDSSYEKLINHFQINSLKCFKIENLKLGIIASGVILHYLYNTCHNNIKHITSIRKINESKYMWIDDFTIRNLEINKSIRNQGVSLISILDKTISPMGSRLLKRWINFPIKEISSIINRQNIVTELLNNSDISIFLSKNLKQISDIERLISKVATEKINPREVITLSNSLEIINKIKNFLDSKSNLLKLFSNKLKNCDNLRNHIINTLNSDPSYQINKGNIIASGVSKELDELRNIVSSNKDYLIKLCNKEQIRTGINNIKIYYNNILGYFLEIRNTYKNKVPSNWIRKQTLVGSERYVTEELKNYELKILGSEKKIITLEIQLFKELIQFISNDIKSLQLNAKLIAIIDVLHSFSICAKQNNYIKPILDKSFDICIKEGRHPVIEKQIDTYIPNNIILNTKDQQIIIITGPNMSGKSAILRQTAIIALMAHIGSYVPATYAKIGLIDRIFSRVGASDNISIGESTFMVEMTETAGILNNISNRSLIILDEIGRGTSTYDGISIAWAIVEYLHQHINRPRTLFSTHYHELNKMMLLFNRIKNYNVSVKEINGNILFLRKLIPGGSTHSFGIHVAKIAGIPSEVIKRSIEILKNIEKKKK
ncbi:MAG: DNA mismatch repair protein MutS [Candidatus Bostrichicola ureolyticus]|nr:MAG: DNA mismatch repair protein MutS [Candidatus Bostrichicola ureolyticus]